MTLRSEPQGHPRMPGQQADVVPGSPLAVTAVITELVRERFRPDSQLAWVWTENPTPDPSETNEPGAARKVLIEPAFNVNTEVKNYRPAIYIDKGETSPSKVALNNFVGQRLRDTYTGFYTVATIPIDIDCVSDQRGESAQLADITWFYVLAGREQIRQTFGFHEMTNPLLGRTTPFEADKAHWSTRVSFEIQINLRWTTVPIAPLLREVVARYRNAEEPDPDTYFLKQYIR